MSYEWTIMVYMAGDNGKLFDGVPLMADLQAEGWQNIADMNKARTSDRVRVLVQYDALHNQENTPRLLIDGKSPRGCELVRLPPVNTGDPRNLTDFIVWSIQQYPAKHYALILWNHGTGWNEDDIYAPYRASSRLASSPAPRPSGLRGQPSRYRTLFRPQLEESQASEEELRGICYDDTSMAFLDNMSLVQALDEANKLTGSKLSVLGMDACLMSALEVACQLRRHAAFMVGSQEVEMASGWPYEPILTSLAEAPTMPPSALSDLIVRRYGDYYLGASRDGGGICTLSAIDLSVVSNTCAKIQNIATAIERHFLSDGATESAVLEAQYRAQRFMDGDSVDLGDFMRLLSQEYSGQCDLGGLAEDLHQHLGLGADCGPVLANFAGRERPRATGLSIYFPKSGCSPLYQRQALAASGWQKAIAAVNRVADPLNPTDSHL